MFGITKLALITSVKCRLILSSVLCAVVAGNQPCYHSPQPRSLHRAVTFSPVLWHQMGKCWSKSQTLARWNGDEALQGCVIFDKMTSGSTVTSVTLWAVLFKQQWQTLLLPVRLVATWMNSGKKLHFKLYSEGTWIIFMHLYFMWCLASLF